MKVVQTRQKKQEIICFLKEREAQEAITEKNGMKARSIQKFV